MLKDPGPVFREAPTTTTDRGLKNFSMTSASYSGTNPPTLC